MFRARTNAFRRLLRPLMAEAKSVSAAEGTAGQVASSLKDSAMAYMEQLTRTKDEIDPSFPWYPYQSLTGFIHLEPLLDEHPIGSLAGAGRLADIGGADGDVAFFMEKCGYSVDMIDHAGSNFNKMKGVTTLKTRLKSMIEVHDVDLDSYFALPRKRYDLIFFLGILYHLKNPFYVLERLSRHTEHLLVSTRIARFSPDGVPIAEIPVAYLLNPAEINNDETNFWIFSESGFKRLLFRTGWQIIAYRTVGDTSSSDPVRPERDERAFAILKSRSSREPL